MSDNPYASPSTDAWSQPLAGAPQAPTYQQPMAPPAPWQMQPGQWVYAPAQARSTNGLAIASMVLGILWIYWLGSILAVIFGHVALSQIRQNPHQGGRGMAIAGVVLGWVGVGFGALALFIGIVAASA